MVVELKSEGMRITELEYMLLTSRDRAKHMKKLYEEERLKKKELEEMLDEAVAMEMSQAIRMRKLEVALRRVWDIMEEPIGEVGERLYAILEPFEDIVMNVTKEELDDQNAREHVELTR